MAKGWTNFANNATAIYPSTPEEREIAKRERIRREHKFSNVIRNTPSLKTKELEKECEIRYIKKQTEEADLLAAFDAKKLKSKTAIKRAINIRKRRAEAEKKEREAALKEEKAPVEAV